MIEVKGQRKRHPSLNLRMDAKPNRQGTKQLTKTRVLLRRNSFTQRKGRHPIE
jgi:hypothetical protein